jgi:hypothetical protein
MNWGWSIVLAFVLFAVFIGGLVAVCVRQDISLVSRNYYQEELAYGQQIRRLENTDRLAVRPNITLEGNDLVIRYDDFAKIKSGTVDLFRPSNAAFDKSFVFISGNESVRTFDVSGMPSGMYKVRMRWQMDDREFFVEEMVKL